MSSKLVAYFSASGVTAGAAKQLAEVSGSDLFAIEPVQPYTHADLDWRNNNSRSKVEMDNTASRPGIRKTIDISGYDTIYIGFPIWWGLAPRIINTFIESADFSGKKIMLFATSGGSGINQAVSALKASYPELDIVGGKLLNGRVTKDIL
ncbi:MAG: flavodoxin [Oscillospiraceae bacterium]